MDFFIFSLDSCNESTIEVMAEFYKIQTICAEVFLMRNWGCVATSEEIELMVH